MARVRVVLRRSPIGCLPKQRATLEALGLRRVGRSRVFENSPQLRGMLARVWHLVEVEELNDRPE